jgi:hypothetical protein
MTMHLCHPALSTTGKKKGKQKFRNAESAAKARTAEAEWKALKEKWGVKEQERKRNRALKAPAMSSYSLSYPPGREPKQHIPSRDTGVGVAARPEDKVYTGTAMLGVATMHKSNSVPVFSQEDAVEISRMRRG